MTEKQLARGIEIYGKIDRLSGIIAEIDGLLKMDGIRFGELSVRRSSTYSYQAIPHFGMLPEILRMIRKRAEDELAEWERKMEEL